jgi:hypothetical protein
MMPIPFQLTAWQKKQATILYHYASLDYLKGLQQRFNDLMAFIDPTLDLAEAQKRDDFLASTRWGMRDTSENWSNNAWPILKTFQKNIINNIANRAFEIYGVTGAYQCARGISEYSMMWTTPDEQVRFDSLFQAVYKYASKIDNTMDKYHRAGRWDDFVFTFNWRDIKHHFSQLPKFQVRTDVQGESGKVPVSTGVYVSQDDSNGALQFAWRGGGNGNLTECSTFNSLGLKALNTVGRDDLWLDDSKMLAFVLANKNDPLISEDSFFKELPKARIAPSVIGLSAFTSRPCKWYFVEMIDGEYEDIDNRPAPASPLRVTAGAPCHNTGVWAAQDVSRSVERYYEAGAIMDDLGSAYGLTVWLWLRNR